MDVLETSASDSAFGRAVMAKCTLRIVGFLSVLFFMAWIDRVNVGFAALQMNGDLGFSATVYGLGAGLFFVGYTIFEIPSNLVLNRVGARLWIARIMVTWGLVSSCFAFIHGETSFYILRLLLASPRPGSCQASSSISRSGSRGRTGRAPFPSSSPAPCSPP